MRVDNPSISAVVPTCDRPETVKQAISSILEQTVVPNEIIVVDNGTQRVDELAFPREVTFIRLRPYAGVSRARNEGVKLSGSDFVAFLDDDDTWASDYIERMLAAVSSSASTTDLLIGRKDRITDGKQVVYKCIENADHLMPRLLYQNHGVGGINIVVRRHTFVNIGGYDENLQNAEDRALALDFIAHDSNIICVPEAVAIMGETADSRLRYRAGQIKDRVYFYCKYSGMMDLGTKVMALLKLVKYVASDVGRALLRLSNIRS